MFRKMLITVAMILCFATPTQAGEGTSTLYGIVTYNGDVIPNALITVIGEMTYTSKSVRTNEKGVYIADKLPADEYLIRAIAEPGGVYKPMEKNVFLWRKTTKEVHFKLEKK